MSVNATMANFGFPATRVAEGERWVVLTRPAQVTLGSLVLVCKEPARAFGALGAEAMVELGGHVRAAEAALSALFAYDRINYLMLMMVDPDVHFHVLPRYAGPRDFAGLTFHDAAWPKPPDPTRPLDLPEGVVPALTAALVGAWPR